MSTPTTPRNACFRLLNGALAVAELDSAAQLADVLVLMAADPGLRPQWDLDKAGQPVWKAVLGAFGARPKSSRKVPPIRSESSSKILYQMWKEDGMDLSPEGKIMSCALAMGLPAFLLCRDQDHPLTERDLKTLLAKEPVVPPHAIEGFTSDWRRHPRLGELLKGLHGISRSYEWMDPNLSAPDVAKIRSYQPWKSTEADKYLLEILAPVLNTPALGPNHINLLTNSTLASNKRPMVYSVSEQAWAQVLYSCDPPPPHNFILPKIHRKLFGSAKATEPFNVPAPPAEWFRALIKQYESSSGQESMTSDPSHRHVLRQLGLSLTQNAMNSVGMDWDILGLGLKAMNLAFGSLAPNSAVVEWVSKHLAVDSSLPPLDKAPDPIVAAMMLSLWVQEVDQDIFYKQLDSWEQITKQACPRSKVQAGVFHGCLANAVYLRLVRAQDDQMHWPELASVFWSHALRSDAKSISGLLPKVLTPVPSSRPDVFAIAPRNEVLTDLLSRPDEIPQLSSGAKTISLRKCFLTLKAAQAGPVIRASAPKM